MQKLYRYEKPEDLFYIIVREVKNNIPGAVNFLKSLKIKCNSAIECISLIYNLIKKKFIYRYEPPGIEYLDLEYEKAITDIYIGDCDDAAFLNCLYMIALKNVFNFNYDVYLCFVSYKENRRLHHAYCEIEISGLKIILDTVRKKSVLYKKMNELKYKF